MMICNQNYFHIDSNDVCEIEYCRLYYTDYQWNVKPFSRFCLNLLQIEYQNMLFNWSSGHQRFKLLAGRKNTLIAMICLQNITVVCSDNRVNVRFQKKT